MVQRAVSPKNPLPLLSGILLKCKDNKLTLMGTDLEIGIECNIPVTTIEEGSIVIPAKYISEISRKLPDVPIDIFVDNDNNTIFIKYNNSEAVLRGFNAEEFPCFPSISENVSFNIATNTIKEMLRQVLYAISTDENRPVFSGVLFEIIDDTLTLVATDTHRLALRKTTIPGLDTNTKVIISGKTLSELLRVMGNTDSNETINVTIGDNQALFSLEDTILVSRLIEGQFPAYEQVIPNNFKSYFRFKVKELLESTERAALLTSSGNEIIRLSIDKDILSINANTEVGGIHEELHIFSKGDSIQVAFNARYLTDVLKTIGKEEAYFELNGPLSPGIIKTVNDDNYLSLILPVRTA